MSRTVNVHGCDQFGRDVVETAILPMPPPYFWLGADAEPQVEEFPTELIAAMLAPGLCGLDRLYPPAQERFRLGAVQIFGGWETR